MSQDGIKELVKAADDATKDLDPEVRTKAFEIVLSHLLRAGETPTPRTKAKSKDATERPRNKGGVSSPLTPIPVDLKGGKEGKPLRDLFKEKVPSNHQEKLTLFTYYLNRTAKVDDVLPGHILTCYNEVGERKPEAIRQLFTDTITDKGWLERGKAEGSVRITITGENLVEHDLPKKEK
jgi:hypothetical protein